MADRVKHQLGRQVLFLKDQAYLQTLLLMPLPPLPAPGKQ